MRVLVALLINSVFNFLIGLVVARFLGPEEFGRFALAMALAMAVQVALFDWMRLAAIRFYSNDTRAHEPAVRATLDVSFAALSGVLVIGAGLLIAIGPHFSLSATLLGLAFVVCVTNAYFDFSIGLLRATFRDRLYARLVIIKNALALCLMAGGAMAFGSAKMALAGGAISIGGATLMIRSSIADRTSTARLASWPLMRRYLSYALPVVAAHLLYLLIPFANRTICTSLFGFAETGQFSLAWDFGYRALQAVGSSLDVVLFQLAVAAHARDGVERAREQVGRNLALMMAFVLPAAVGLWLVLPSIERLVVPAEFQGPFAHYLTLLLPGLIALSLAMYGVNQAFQIEKRTLPLTMAALVGCAGTPLFLLAMPRGDDASGLALGQSGAYLAALFVLVGFGVWTRSLRWPSRRDLLAVALGLALLLATGLPLRRLEPGFATLLAQILVGGSVYLGVAFLLDLGGLRPKAEALLASRLGWRSPAAVTGRKS